MSMKVLGPKWRKRAISESCHESCCELGRGRIGIGGGFGNNEEIENEIWQMKMKIMTTEFNLEKGNCNFVDWIVRR